MHILVKSRRRWRLTTVVAGLIVTLVAMATPASADNGWGPLPEPRPAPLWICGSNRPNADLHIRACAVSSTLGYAQPWTIVINNSYVNTYVIEWGQPSLYRASNDAPITSTACLREILAPREIIGCAAPSKFVGCGTQIYATTVVQIGGAPVRDPSPTARVCG
jgi:hypothetical protein